jgi:DNA-binding NtrC family response regulator
LTKTTTPSAASWGSGRESIGDAARIEKRPGILVVDDDEGIRENIVDLLSSEEYRVLSAGDAAEALRVMKSEKIDLLLTDFQMPGANGVELIEAARRTDGDISAILMTAYLYVYEQLDEERKQGITLLRKPFDAQDVLDLVKEELRRKRPLEN